MKIRSAGVLLVLTFTAAGCDGLREALTAHTDVAARAESRELSVTRLSDLLGNASIGIPVNRETAGILTDLWVSYELLGVAAARGDSLTDTKAIDEATIGITANVKLNRYMQSIAQNIKADSATEAGYNQAAGGVLVARHILFATPGGASQQQKDSVRRRAESVRSQLTTANFADMAKRYSNDPGSAQRGGNLGAFTREQMIKEFSNAVAALRPGEISQPVESSYGYHIIQRPTYATAKSDYDQAFTAAARQGAESTFIAKVDAEAKITVRNNAGATAKNSLREAAQHRDDGDVLATYTGGDLTVSEFLRWVESYPPQMRIQQQLTQAPDSIAKQFVKSIARNEVMLRRADSAGVKLGDEEKQQLYGEFKSLVGNLWQQLGLDPKSLADSAKTVPEREKLAAARVDAYLDRVMAGQAPPLSVPAPVQHVLQSKFDSKMYPAGIDRAIERAQKLRRVADSTRAAQQPRSQVPLPLPPADSGARRDTGRTKRP